MGKISKENSYSALLDDIGALLIKGRKTAEQQVNSILVNTYWLLATVLLNLNKKVMKRLNMEVNC